MIRLVHRRLEALADARRSQLLADPATKADFDATSEQIRDLIAATTFWHGTGLFAHEFNGDGNKFENFPTGKIVHTGQKIVSEGLTPHPIWTKRDKPHNAISVDRRMASAWLYAMMYQDKDQPETDLAYKRFLWNLLNYEIAKHTKLRDMIHYFRTYILGAAFEQIGIETPKWQAIKQQYARWIAGSTLTEKHGPFGFRHVRSDISGNTPLVIGIKNANYPRHDMSSTPDLRAFEERITELIGQEKITHIQAPLTEIAKVREELRTKIPVIPIEYAQIIGQN